MVKLQLLENLYNKYLTNLDTVESKGEREIFLIPFRTERGEINHQHILQEFKKKKNFSPMTLPTK
ncbi:MAG: hypothetical protein CM15mP12_6300 [Gammaproteobacteria bacterium]|nr:MAG: hypothetical protein CM15mP12_6300 [Gammaproteobacteria bacterium]